MYPVIASLYGSFNINSYGLAIAVGLLAAIGMALRDERCLRYGFIKHLNGLLVTGFCGALLGGRLLFCLTEAGFDCFLYVWQGGFCIMGSLIGGLLAFLIYAYLHSLPSLMLLDCLATYVPLLQSIARIGCFLAGCCSGTPSSLPWAVSHPEVPSEFVHPTALYSALLLFVIFLIMRYSSKIRSLPAGGVAVCYLVLVGIERGILDFWRASRVPLYGILSQQQAIIIVIVASAIALSLGGGVRTINSNRPASS